jgi:hypothetical protein
MDAWRGDRFSWKPTEFDNHQKLDWNVVFDVLIYRADTLRAFRFSVVQWVFPVGYPFEFQDLLWFQEWILNADGRVDDGFFVGGPMMKLGFCELLSTFWT